MKTAIKYGLEGAFKVDLYSGQQFMETTDWFANFITHTGLSYPSVYAFADCFRFLSIGTSAGGNVPNSGFTQGNQNNHTTGLAQPIITYGTSTGNQLGQYIGWEGYEVGSEGQESPCGTTLTYEGLELYRAWSIPYGDSLTTVDESPSDTALYIGEFMVSPSSGSDPSGKYAFSRITRQLSIKNGWRAVISYKLKIKLNNTGRTALSAGAFATGNADITNDADLIAGWSQAHGYYRQVYPGLACINKRGASYIPKYGAIMEPSFTDLKTLAFYLSPDNAAFDVNGLQGGAQSDANEAYASDGLMKGLAAHKINLTHAGPDGYESWDYTAKAAYYNKAVTHPDRYAVYPTSPQTPYNIRLGGDSNTTPLKTPSVAQYSVDNAVDLGNFQYQEFQDATTQEISFATPGVGGWSDNDIDLGEKAVFATRAFRLPPYIPTGRRKTVTRKALFAPVSALGRNTRFGSMVVAYRASSDDTDYPEKVFYPMIDCQFFNSDDEFLMHHYRLIPSIYFTKRGSGIASATVSIYTEDASTPVPSIQRIWKRRTCQGPYNASFEDGIDTYGHPCFDNSGNPIYLDGTNQIGYKQSGDICTGLGGFTINDANNSSGYGIIYGLVGDVDFYTYGFDEGLYFRDVDSLANPTNASPIYWPDSTKQLKLAIEDLVFSTDGVNFTGDAGESTAYWAARGVYRPTGYIWHAENVGSSGFRLLPLHGIPNHSGENTYPVLTGGYYPGLSSDNGLELYLDVSWTAPCGVAANCDENS